MCMHDSIINTCVFSQSFGFNRRFHGLFNDTSSSPNNFYNQTQFIISAVKTNSVSNYNL